MRRRCLVVMSSLQKNDQPQVFKNLRKYSEIEKKIKNCFEKDLRRKHIKRKIKENIGKHSVLEFFQEKYKYSPNSFERIISVLKPWRAYGKIQY